MKAHPVESPRYQKNIKDLSKDYPHVEDDIGKLLETLLDDPTQQAKALPRYKQKLWKVRVASTDMQRGKRGGFRVIFGYDVSKPDTVYLLRAYVKPKREDLPHTELQRLYNRFVEHLESISKINKDTSPPSDS